MSLTLSSSDEVFDAVLKQMGSDGSISPLELQNIRDNADKHVAEATAAEPTAAAPTGTAQNAMAPAATETAFRDALAEVLSQADGLVEGMQHVALSARKIKLSAPRREALKAAIEHQMAYVIAGYQSSLQRL